MFSKQEMKLILASCLSLLFISFFTTFSIFYMESLHEDQGTLILTIGEYVPIILMVSLFIVYPVLLVAFVTPFMILRHYNVNIWVRILVYLVAGVLIMIIPTILDRYSFICILIAGLFGLFDFIWARVNTSIDGVRRI